MTFATFAEIIGAAVLIAAAGSAVYLWATRKHGHPFHNCRSHLAQVKRSEYCSSSAVLYRCSICGSEWMVFTTLDYNTCPPYRVSR